MHIGEIHRAGSRGSFTRNKDKLKILCETQVPVLRWIFTHSHVKHCLGHHWRISIDFVGDVTKNSKPPYLMSKYSEILSMSVSCFIVCGGFGLFFFFNFILFWLFWAHCNESQYVVGIIWSDSLAWPRSSKGDYCC